jgi:hypothetical protein
MCSAKILPQQLETENNHSSVTNFLINLDFRFSPCSETYMGFFGYFPGVRLSFADVSEPSVRSIFKGWMKNILHPAFEDGQVSY